MSNRLIIYMTAAVLLCVVTLLSLNFLSIFTAKTPTETYLNYNDVRGVEVIHNQKPYTLNFDQQNQLISLLNLAKKTEGDYQTLKKQTSMEEVGFEKITIFLFNGPNVEVIPIGLDHKKLIYSVPQWNSNGFFDDNSNGSLLSLISKTYSY